MLKNPFRAAVRYQGGLPVAPGSFPVLGHIPTLYQDAPSFYDEARRSLGPLFWVNFFRGSQALIWAEREAFDLFKSKAVDNQHYHGLVGTLLGQSMLGLDGPPHHHARSAVSATFTPRGLSARRVGEIMAELIEQRVRGWMGRGEFAVLPETQELALDIIFRIMGIRSQELSGWRAQYRKLLFDSAFNIPIDVPGSPLRRAKEARGWLEDRLSALIEEARRSPSADVDGGLIAAMVHGRDEDGVGLSQQELLDNFVLLALAGHETTASTMAWLMLHLAQRPELWDALVAEAEKGQGLPVSPQEIRGYPFAEGLFRETVRLHPPVNAPTRRINAWTTILGHRIPPGTAVGICISLLSRDPEVYPDPERFDPTRWKGRAVTPLETCQFGGGPHFCLGYHLAWMEVVQFALALAQACARQGLRPQIGQGTLKRGVHFPLTQPSRGARVVFK